MNLGAKKASAISNACEKLWSLPIALLSQAAVVGRMRNAHPVRPFHGVSQSDRNGGWLELHIAYFNFIGLRHLAFSAHIAVLTVPLALTLHQ
jgi:hypothetical protein